MGVAQAYETADFACCHVQSMSMTPERMLQIAVVVPEDHRAVHMSSRDGDRVGVVRGGYGNPLPLYGREPVVDYAAGSGQGCTKDTDCKGNRVCDRGVCDAP